MTSKRIIPGVLAIGLLMSPASAQEAPLQPDPADAVEMIELMLGRVPSRHGTPLAAMHGLADLYGRSLDQAKTGVSGALGLWILLGDVTWRTADAGLMQSYAADMLPLYRLQPEAFLAALSDAPWLAASACHYLSAYFGSEDRAEEGRAPFLENESARISNVLPKPVAETCLETLASAQ
ncbi:MAG: hypothetical protein JJ869_13135 [Marivita sp.]|uniref:hypothetical protein n=1 Tax=Marivita sp. TaxID=2003365 RepID=UPI001AFE5017|nr:hypothetical protein [Marivita sp.]MBO6884506.1 hypothetical protein [Marivita sp.]